MTKVLQGGSKPAPKKKPAAKPKPKPVDRRLAAIRQHGIVINPQVVIDEAHRAGIPLEVACAILMQETGGGRNEWGHDPTIFVGGYDARHNIHYGETVTEQAYRAYLAQRGPAGHGGMQGVGPCQLTYFAFQDEADREGGCWQPRFNIRVGFRYLAGNVRHDGLRAGIAAYNGAGPAAQHYADSVLALTAQWRQHLA